MKATRFFTIVYDFWFIKFLCAGDASSTDDERWAEDGKSIAEAATEGDAGV